MKQNEDRDVESCLDDLIIRAVLFPIVFTCRPHNWKHHPSLHSSLEGQSFCGLNARCWVHVKLMAYCNADHRMVTSELSFRLSSSQRASTVADSPPTHGTKSHPSQESTWNGVLIGTCHTQGRPLGKLHCDPSCFESPHTSHWLTSLSFYPWIKLCNRSLRENIKFAKMLCN